MGLRVWEPVCLSRSTVHLTRTHTPIHTHRVASKGAVAWERQCNYRPLYQHRIVVCVGLLFYGQLVVIGSSSNRELLTPNMSANLVWGDFHIRRRRYETATLRYIHYVSNTPTRCTDQTSDFCCRNVKKEYYLYYSDCKDKRVYGTYLKMVNFKKSKLLYLHISVLAARVPIFWSYLIVFNFCFIIQTCSSASLLRSHVSNKDFGCLKNKTKIFIRCSTHWIQVCSCRADVTCLPPCLSLCQNHFIPSMAQFSSSLYFPKTVCFGRETWPNCYMLFLMVFPVVSGSCYVLPLNCVLEKFLFLKKKTTRC